ncbi:MAG: hypothetical protein RL198_399 [Actinomycetota bacterium]
MRSRLVLIVIAAILAVVSALAVVSLISNAEQRVLSRFEARSAYVAVLPIPVGTSFQDAIANELIATEQFPSESLPMGLLQDAPAAPAEVFAASNIAPGQIILQSSFGPAVPETARISIPPGLLAMSIELTLPARVADLVTPGSEVAVFASYPMQGEGTTGFTDLLIPRAKVLAVGSITTEVDSSQESAEVPNSVVTLALSQDDAQRLIFVTNSGGTVNLGLLSSSTELTDSLLITPENAFN